MIIITDYLVNHDIKAQRVFLIGANGEKLGEKHIKQAMYLAREAQLDLVCMTPNKEIPTCKILNYNKFMFEGKKKEKSIEKAQRAKETVSKEVQLSFNIALNDMKTKAKTCQKWLDKGNVRVNVVLPLRGRTQTKTELAVEKVEEFLALLNCTVTKKPNFNGNGIIASIEPTKE